MSLLCLLVRFVFFRLFTSLLPPPPSSPLFSPPPFLSYRSRHIHYTFYIFECDCDLSLCNCNWNKTPQPQSKTRMGVEQLNNSARVIYPACALTLPMCFKSPDRGWVGSSCMNRTSTEKQHLLFWAAVTVWKSPHELWSPPPTVHRHPAATRTWTGPMLVCTELSLPSRQTFVRPTLPVPCCHGSLVPPLGSRERCEITTLWWISISAAGVQHNRDTPGNRPAPCVL